MNQNALIKHATTAACIFLTGASGMMYQVTWQRYLARLLGGDATATAVVLAAFLGGLSLGYGSFGRLSARIKRPWFAYAVVEAGIGLWGLAFPALFALVQSASANLSLAAPWLLAAQGFLLAAVLIGPPTICMGATVPLLTQALSLDLASSGRVHARLYGINTAGAFWGAVLAGYFTIPALGLPGTLRLCAAINLTAACWFACTVPPILQVRATVSRNVTSLAQSCSRSLVTVFMVIALLNGFQTIALENVLIRFVALSMGGSAYAFTMVVSVFVLAIAAGALVVARLSNQTAKTLWINQALIAISLLLIYPTLDTWPYWTHRLRLVFDSDIAGFWGYQAAAFGSLLLIIVVPAALLGAAVPLIFSCLRRDLGTVGHLSGHILCVNTIGNLIGSLAAGLLLHPWLNNGQIFLLCIVAALCTTWLAAHTLASSSRLIAACAAVAGIALLPITPGYAPERFMIGTFKLQTPLLFSYAGPSQFYQDLLQDVEPLFHEDGPEASVTVLRTPKLPWSPEAPMAIMVNGKSDSSTVADMATLRLLAHLPALLAPQRTSALVIGLGTGVTSAELARYQTMERIDTAEISSSVIKALPVFAPFTESLHLDQRHTVIHGDAFRIMARSDRRWDTIISEPSNPWVLGVDALFSREFYRLAKEHLNDGGLFVQWIHIQNASDRMLGTVLATLRAEFPHLRVFMSQANDLILLASLEPLPDVSLDRAAGLLADNISVAGSLTEAGIPSLEALLARELVPGTGLQGSMETLDRPRLHYLAGKSFFMGDRVRFQQLMADDDQALNDSGLLARYAAGRPQGPLTTEEVKGLVETLVDRSGEEATPLPIQRAIGERLLPPRHGTGL